jgi:hypothetical protein
LQYSRSRLFINNGDDDGNNAAETATHAKPLDLNHVTKRSRLLAIVIMEWKARVPPLLAVTTAAATL